MNSIDNLIRRIRKSDSQNRDPITGIANPTVPSFTLRNADTWTVIAVVAEDDLTAAILDFNDLSVSVLVERSTVSRSRTGSGLPGSTPSWLTSASPPSRHPPES